MDSIKNEIKNIIDNAFELKKNNFNNSFEGKKAKSIELENIIDTALNNCLAHLNNNYPSQAKEFADSGFISEYLKEKQIEYLFG